MSIEPQLYGILGVGSSCAAGLMWLVFVALGIWRLRAARLPAAMLILAGLAGFFARLASPLVFVLVDLLWSPGLNIEVLLLVHSVIRLVFVALDGLSMLLIALAVGLLLAPLSSLPDPPES